MIKDEIRIYSYYCVYHCFTEPCDCVNVLEGNARNSLSKNKHWAYRFLLSHIVSIPETKTSGKVRYPILIGPRPEIKVLHVVLTAYDYLYC